MNQLSLDISNVNAGRIHQTQKNQKISSGEDKIMDKKIKLWRRRQNYGILQNYATCEPCSLNFKFHP